MGQSPYYGPIASSPCQPTRWKCNGPQSCIQDPQGPYFDYYACIDGAFLDCGCGDGLYYVCSMSNGMPRCCPNGTVICGICESPGKSTCITPNQSCYYNPSDGTYFGYGPP
jgi:hypothetical protein